MLQDLLRDARCHLWAKLPELWACCNQHEICQALPVLPALTFQASKLFFWSQIVKRFKPNNAIKTNSCRLLWPVFTSRPALTMNFSFVLLNGTNSFDLTTWSACSACSDLLLMSLTHLHHPGLLWPALSEVGHPLKSGLFSPSLPALTCSHII